MRPNRQKDHQRSKQTFLIEGYQANIPTKFVQKTSPQPSDRENGTDEIVG